MEIRLPKGNDRDIEAIEQIFAQIHAIRRDLTWWERWWKGQFILKASFEIVSLEGHIRFFVRSTFKHQNLVKAAIHAQYPEAEVVDVREEDDFIHIFPDTMPDDQFDMLGTEYILFKPNHYPMKTYKEYETQGGKGYSDPLRHLFEIMSSLKEGEYLWYQLVVVAEDEFWALDQKKHVDEIKGTAPEEKSVSESIVVMFVKQLVSILKLILFLPFSLVREIFRQLSKDTGKIALGQVKGTGSEMARQIYSIHNAFLDNFRKRTGGEAQATATATIEGGAPVISVHPEVTVNMPEEKESSFPAIWNMTDRELKSLEAIERKLSKQMFKTCFRALYFAKKPVFAKFRFWSEFHGFLRHFNDIDRNIWYRGPHTKTTADYFFSRIRKRIKQNSLIFNAKGRDWYAGDEWVYLSSEELATLWHLPHKDDQKGNFAHVEEVKKPGPTPLRAKEGYTEERMIENIETDTVPENLPVTEYEPYNYN